MMRFSMDSTIAIFLDNGADGERVFAHNPGSA